MAKSIFASGSNNATIAESLTRYTPLASVYQPSDTEAYTQKVIRTAGVFSNLWLALRWNDFPSNVSSVITLRVDGADGNQSISIPGSQTGFYQDITHVDAVTAGKKVNFKIVTPAGAGKVITIANMSVMFFPDDRSLTMSLATLFQGYSSSSNTVLYIQLGGNYNNATFEANVTNDINITGTIKNMTVYVSANTKGGAVVWRIRKNSGNGNVGVSVGAAATGVFEDTANSDSLTANDDLSIQRDASAGASGSIQARLVSVEVLTTDGTFMFNGGVTSGTSTNFNSKEYIGFSSELWYWTEGWMNMILGVKGLVSNLTVVISANTLNVAANWKLRKMNAATNVAVSITASTTGIFEDGTNSVLFYPAQYGCVERDTTPASSGAMTVIAYGMKVQSHKIKDVVGERDTIPFLR